MVRHTHEILEHFGIQLSDLLPLQDLNYEGHKFPAPNDQRAYLSAMYGYLGHGGVYNAKTHMYDAPST